MDDLSKFPKRLLVTAVVMIVIFMGLVSITFFYHPVVPFPYKLSITVGKKILGENDKYEVRYLGTTHLQPGKAYKVKIFVRGEGHFSTLIPETVSNNNEQSTGVISGIGKIKVNDMLEGVTYKDSLSSLPLVMLMFK